jgi:hypothetical protein
MKTRAEPNCDLCSEFESILESANAYNELLRAFDRALGFPNKKDSRFRKRYQTFDQKTGEHVFGIEYRTRVNPGVIEPPNAKVHPRHLPLIREIDDLTHNDAMRGEQSVPSDFELKKDEEQTQMAVKRARKPLRFVKDTNIVRK